MATKAIKIYDGVRVIHDHEIVNLDHICDLWELFNWDVKNDPNAKECADIITRELICFGFMDLTKMTNSGKMLTVELLPPTE